MVQQRNFILKGSIGVQGSSWGLWGSCRPENGSPDQTCHGVRTRVNDAKDPVTQTGSCFLTTG